MHEAVRYEPMALLWIMTMTGVLLFMFGAAYRISVWLEGRVGPYGAGVNKWRKFGYCLRMTCFTVLSRRFWSSLGKIVANGLIHTSLKAQDDKRWCSHLLVFGSFLALFLLSTFTGIFVDLLPLGFGIHTPLGTALENKETFWLAAANEILGVILLIGLIRVYLRRFVQKDTNTLTSLPDRNMWLFLFAITVTGFATEAVRLVAQDVPATASWASFVGLSFASILKNFSLDWKALHVSFWIMHIFVSSAFFAYIPFSKMFHAVATPLLTTWKTLQEADSSEHIIKAGISKEVLRANDQKLTI